MNAENPSPEASGCQVQPADPAASSRPWRRRLLVVAAAAAVALLTATTLVPWITSREHRSAGGISQAPDAGALQRWWAESHDDVDALRHATDDAQHGLATRDPAAVSAACQRMHDVGELALKARLPAPEPGLNADLSGAIEDSHSAAHMCLAAESGTSNNYSGEFRSDLDQVERQLRMAQDLINRVLAKA